MIPIETMWFCVIRSIARQHTKNDWFTADTSARFGSSVLTTSAMLSGWSPYCWDSVKDIERDEIANKAWIGSDITARLENAVRQLELPRAMERIS